MSAIGAKPRRRRRHELKALLQEIPWGETAIPAAGLACGECGGPVGDDGYANDSGWARCRPCIDAWARARGTQKVAPEKVLELLEAGVELPTCRTCRGPLEREGKRVPLLFTDGNGEISGGYCRPCTDAWREQRAQAMLHAEILQRAGKGRSKG